MNRRRLLGAASAFALAPLASRPAFAQAYPQFQDRLILREAFLVAFFLAGLVVLGGLQSWWLQPLVSGLQPLALFAGALGLTAITDNAALTYLGAQIAGISSSSQYMLMAGAVAGGLLAAVHIVALGDDLLSVGDRRGDEDHRGSGEKQVAFHDAFLWQ